MLHLPADVLGIELLVFRYTPHLLCLNENIPQEIWWYSQNSTLHYLWLPLFSFWSEPPIFVRDSIFCSSLLHKSSVLLASVGGGRGMPRPEINRGRNNCMEVYIIKKQNVLGFLYQMFLWIFSGKQYIKYKTKHISKIIISRKGLPFF